MKVNITYCSGIALINDGRIFLIRPFLSNNDKWGIPKGHIEVNETVEKTAIREFNEETGIKLVGNISFLSTVTTKYKNNIKNVNVYKCISSGKEQFIKSNIITEGQFSGNPENVDGQWFSYDEALEKIHKYQIPIVEKLKAEDKSFKTFYVNREATSDASDIKYNKTICVYLNDSGWLSKDDLEIIQKYSNMLDKIIIFVYNDEDIKKFIESNRIKNIEVIVIDRPLHVTDIINYIERNFNEVDVLIGSNKKDKLYNKLYEIKKYFIGSNINILDLKQYSMGIGV